MIKKMERMVRSMDKAPSSTPTKYDRKKNPEIKTKTKNRVKRFLINLTN